MVQEDNIDKLIDESIDPSVRPMSVLNPDNDSAVKIDVKYDSGCDFSGAMSYSRLQKIKDATGIEPTIHKIDPPVEMVLADESVAESPTEYVELECLLHFKHGALAVTIKFCLLNKCGGKETETYLGIPVLAFLGALPTQALERYVTTQQYKNFDSVPLCFEKAAKVAAMTSSDVNQMGSHSDNNMQSPSNEVKLPPAVEESLKDLRLIDSAEEEEKTPHRNKEKLEQLKELIAQDPRWNFEDQKYQKKEPLLDQFAEKLYDYVQLTKKVRRKLGRAKKHKGSVIPNMPNVQEFLDILLNYTDVWRTDFGDDGFADVTPLPLKWNPHVNDGKGPLKGAKGSRPLSNEEDKFFRQHKATLIDCNIMERVKPSDEWVQQNGIPQCCTMFIIPKKQEGEYRMIEDFRLVNECTQVFNYHLVNVREAQKTFKGAEYYSTFDALKGYNQFPVSKELSYHLVIITPRGEMYRFKALPMGYANSAQWYTFVMNEEVLKDLVYHVCLAYIDDILIFGKTGNQLLRHMHLVLEACRAKNVQLNIKKSFLFRTQVEWCGRLLGPGGTVRLHPNTVKALTAIERPTNARELQQFVCSLNWCRQWIHDYPNQARPLEELLEQCYKLSKSRKRKSVEKVRIIPESDPKLTAIDLHREKGQLWTKKHEECLKKLKQLLKNSLELTAPDESLDRNILVDASEYAWSLVITQTHPNERKLPVEERNHQILYLLSGKFTSASANWHISEKEAYGIYRAATDVEWLMHPAKPLHIYTDHRNLLKLFNPKFVDSTIKKPAASRLLRWSLSLLGCNYQIHSIDGNRNVLADYLSRKRHDAGPPRKVGVKAIRVSQPIVPTELDQNDPAAIRFRKSRVQPLLNPEIWITDLELAKVQRLARNNGDLNHLPDRTTTTVLSDGNRLYKVDDKPVIPKGSQSRDLTARLLIIAHTQTGHRGIHVVSHLLKQKFHFIGGIDQTALQQFTRECLHCRPRISMFNRRFARLKRARNRNEILHMDYYYVDQGEFFSYVLALMDDFSQFVHLIPAAKATADVAVQAILQWKAQHGLRPNVTIVSDNGTHFTASVIKDLNTKLQLKHKFTLANSPWTNARIERNNREIKELFATLLSQFRIPVTQWHEITHVVAEIINHLPRRRSDGKYRTPMELFHAFKPEELSSLRPMILLGGDIQTSDVSNYVKSGSKEEELVTQAVKVISHEKDFDEIVEEHAQVRDKLSHELMQKEIIELAKEERYFNEHLNFAPGDYVLVAQDKEIGQNKTRFKWTGPALITEMKGNSIAKIRHLFKPKTTEEIVREEDIHTARLAFYSRVWEDQELEVRHQILHDTSKFVPDELVALDHDPNHKEGYAIEVKWEGFPEDYNSMEPVDSLYEDMPNRVLRWLLQQFKETKDDRYSDEYERLLKRHKLNKRKRSREQTGTGKRVKH